MYRGSVFFSQIIPEENAASTCMLPKNEKEKKRAALGMIKQGQYDRLKLHRIRSRVIIVPLGGERTCFCSGTSCSPPASMLFPIGDNLKDRASVLVNPSDVL